MLMAMVMLMVMMTKVNLYWNQRKFIVMLMILMRYYMKSSVSCSVIVRKIMNGKI